MLKSKTELSLQQLNEQIHMIVRGQTQNDTSYFLNHQMLLQSFQNYLQCLGIGCCEQSQPNHINKIQEFFIFQEAISSLQLFKYKRFIKCMLIFSFPFKDHFQNLIFDSLPRKITQKNYLSQVNITEVIFLIYLCLQIDRKEIFGKNRGSSKNMFLLKQIIKILDQFNVNNENQSCLTKDKNDKFSINQDKLVKLLLLKALKIKLQKQNFSLGPSKCQQDKSILQESIINKQQQRMLQQDKKEMDRNFSLISIRSEYNQSQLIKQSNDKLKQSLALLPLDLKESLISLQMKNLSSEEIFQYISLNELKGYISQ